MKPRRRRSRARALSLVVLAALMGVVLVLFPLKSRGAPANADSGAPPHAPAGKAGKKAAIDSKDASAPAPAPVSDAGAHRPEPHAAKEAEKEKGEKATIPVGKGLPVHVDVAVFFLEITTFDDTKAEFEGTTDIRLEWTDPHLAFPDRETLRGYREFIGKAAEEELGKIWSPSIDVKNRTETGSYVGRRVRIYPHGQVEVITRASGKFKTTIDTEAFPFDRQKLAVELIVRDESVDEVLLQFDKDDVEFSHAGADVKVDGWEVGLVDLSAGVVPGWNGDRYSRATATLLIDRLPGSSVASVFIPLIASLLIPLLALWMNKASEEGFAVDAFELANMGIGGLFSVIALSFAIYSSNPVIASADNTVTRLFGLNYAMLALSLIIVVTFFRYEIPKRWFGAYVQEEAFHFISWAAPLLALVTAAAFLLVAAA